jgi:hypothetical protein
MALFTMALGLYGGVLWSGGLQGYMEYEMMPTSVLPLRGEARSTTRVWAFGSLASDWLLALPLQRPHIRLSAVQTRILCPVVGRFLGGAANGTKPPTARQSRAAREIQR